MYNPNVRLDDWLEVASLANSKLAAYLRERDRKELMVQQTRELFCNLLREVSLSKNETFIKFGSYFQLRSLNGDKTNNEIALAASINEYKNRKSRKVDDSCIIVCTPFLLPCVRNTFIVQPADCTERKSSNILFGEEITIQLAESTDKPLYLRSEIPLVDGIHTPLGQNPVQLSNKMDCYCKWKVSHQDINKRFETQNAPVPAFERIILNHVMTGKCLTMELAEHYITIFGMEYGSSVHAYTDAHRQEDTNCLWSFVIESSTL